MATTPLTWFAGPTCKTGNISGCPQGMLDPLTKQPLNGASAAQVATYYSGAVQAAGTAGATSTATTGLLDSLAASLGVSVTVVYIAIFILLIMLLRGKGRR